MALSTRELSLFLIQGFGMQFNRGSGVLGTNGHLTYCARKQVLSQTTLEGNLNITVAVTTDKTSLANGFTEAQRSSWCLNPQQALGTNSPIPVARDSV